MSGWNLPADVELIDIKKNMYTSNDIAEMFRLTGSYEALFSKRSQNFVAQGLKETIKSDEDYGELLPKDYTFLKRPVLIFDEQIFVGNDKKTDEEVKRLLANSH